MRIRTWDVRQQPPALLLPAQASSTLSTPLPYLPTSYIWRNLVKGLKNAEKVDNLLLHLWKFIDKGSGRTKRAKPISNRQCHKDRAETEHVESSVTGITEKHFLLTVTTPAFLTYS